MIKTLLPFFMLVADTVFAQWQVNGIPVTNASGQQLIPSVTMGSDSTVFVVWADYQSGTSNIYLQAYTKQGTMQWAVNGVPICSATGDQINPEVASDGSGGAIVVWEDYRNGATPDVYAQRVSPTGSVLWATNGIVVCNASGAQLNPVITADSNGAVVVWEDHRGAQEDLFAQRITVAGTTLWTGNGLVVAVVSAIKLSPRIVSDGIGGAIIAWEDYRKGTESDVYAQRLMSNGALSWGSAGVAVCAADYSQSRISVAPSDSGSILITWEDYRSNNSGDIYSQKLSVAGTPLWTLGGAAACNQTATQLFPAICSDGFGGAFLVWQDFRNGADIYAQHMHASGDILWMQDGEPVCDNAAYQDEPMLCMDGSGGILITWTDYRNGIGDIFAQRIASNSWQQWTPNGTGVCLNSLHQQSAFPLPDGSGGVLVTWSDYRASAADIYAQRVDGNGIALPVEMLSFSAEKTNGRILVRWKTATERNLIGFEIQVSTIVAGPFRVGGFECARSPNGGNYQIALDQVDISFVRLRLIDADGTSMLTAVMELPPDIIERIAVTGLAPLPARTGTNLLIDLPVSTRIHISMWNMAGQLIRTIYNGSADRGRLLLPISTISLPSGTYQLVIWTENYTISVYMPVVH